MPGQPEMVDHPPHYNSLGACCPGCGRPIECIDVVRHFNFVMGTIIKYAWRAGLKPGEPMSKDLRKIAWYASNEAEHQERLEAKS